MAIFLLSDYDVDINSVDLSDHVKSAVLNYAAEMLDDTVMGDDTRSRLAGLKDWSIDIEFLQDFASGKVDATLFPLIGAAAFPCLLRPTSSAKGATNPEFTGQGVLESYTPMAGAIGDLAGATCTIQAAGTLTREV